MQINPLEAIVVVLSIVGNVYVAYGQKKGFYVWIASNLIGAVMFYGTHQWGLLVLQGFYFACNVTGIRKWKTNICQREAA